MENKNIPVVDQAPQKDIPNGLLKMAIDEYGLASLVGAGLVALLGATIGGLIGIKIYIK